MREHKYLSFIELTPKAKTKRFEVRNKLADCKLGDIKWYSPWRKYCFFVYPNDLVFDAGCLADIQDFLTNLMRERKIDKTAESYCTKCGKNYEVCTCEFSSDTEANKCTKIRVIEGGKQ
jgi:hypothetical protein